MDGAYHFGAFRKEEKMTDQKLQLEIFNILDDFRTCELTRYQAFERIIDAQNEIRKAGMVRRDIMAEAKAEAKSIMVRHLHHNYRYARKPNSGFILNAFTGRQSRGNRKKVCHRNRQGVASGAQLSNIAG